VALRFSIRSRWTGRSLELPLPSFPAIGIEE
jgi:hypothetical protein